MRKRHRLLMLCPALAFAAAAHAFDLTVEVRNARSDQGMVAAAVFVASNWRGTPLQGQRQPAGPRVVFVYRNLPAGRYAVSAFHDENGNGKLDANLVGMPTEPYGFSRDARALMGPPSFADAAFDLQADTRITVNLR